MKPNTCHIISLGCAKNTVDSDSMAQLLMASGFRMVNQARQAQVVIVNTCGFIAPARDESLGVLKELAQKKSKGQWLVAAGCLTQRYGAEVVRQATGVDAVLGTRRWMDIVKVLQKLRAGGAPLPLYHLPDTDTVGAEVPGVLRAAVQGKSAYLKIADGCRRPCAFCAIPLIKGTAVSRPLPALVSEAIQLQEQGVSEIILIAQDTTDYGHDLGMVDGLAQLLEALVAAVPRVDWLRILYAYPGYVTDRLIDTIAAHNQVLPYLDIPLQHAHPDTLRRMRRPANLEWVQRTIEKMRLALPDLALRTTFLVGYPGESEQEFQTLLDFMAEIQFDRVGAFQFSFEPGTASEALGDPVPADVKQQRWERLMEQQQAISLARNQALVGKTLEVLIEGEGQYETDDRQSKPAGKILLGRSYRDAPEIDGLVIVEGQAPPGSLVAVRITGAMPYDLSGVMQEKNNSIRTKPRDRTT